ncbi:apoptosis-inducing factor 2 [Rhinatrema bivittatum]|uniref:apoptosis-inducing factor 2 n=1 Tax=Rhinatrema bivittatum TaxID=194408 RepID=UPI00112E176A|nr:apoptosis-inducing factor 2 [Rhinatrema bivittatum]XP_029465145.1 apoptosis-inducing factor 2 [Rhinatrema bivittatum]XP_029465146.1 apoptosis-inducing factor 2 [Rhinatrema bivittatum]
MGSKLSVDNSVCVVIVGGGFGGIAAASQLKSWGVPFVLVDMKEAFHHNVAALRASVESGFARKTFISYAASFSDSFKQGKVIGIDLEKQHVLLEDGEKLPFSHLILATGSDGPFPGKFNQPVSMEDAIQMYEDLVKEIQKAKRIVVVGGGSAGVEMAAEVKTDYPDKEVTLIHSKVALADTELQPCVRCAVKEILLKKGVQLVLGQRVSNLGSLTKNRVQENMEIKLDKGTEIIADLVICCTGIKVNSFGYCDAFGGKLAEDGALQVNKELQVEGYPNVYAIGDCANVKEPKMAYHAGLHANIAVTNIINSLTNQPLKSYTPGSLTMLLSMGRNDGVGQLYGCYVGSFVVKIAKSRDLFVGKSWKEMGQSMPH